MINTKSHMERIKSADIAVDTAAETARKDYYRLCYHIIPKAGWMNDPNGLIQFNGQYHVFYQHHPYSSEWGPMHWGHVVSRDLVHWEHMPVALAPGEYYDEGGCWSGSAVDNDGVLTLIFSGNTNGQVQCLATSIDGISFTKYEKNPIIDCPPPDGSGDFRDPKVWKHNDSWYMIVGSAKDGRGKILLYKSDDLKYWEYIGVVAESDGTMGYMWECPDLFELDGKHVLIISPMGMEGHKNIFIVGEMNYHSGKFTQEYHGEIDMGKSFYAAQTFKDSQGRRVLIGWMEMWGSDMPSQVNGWSGAMTVPRILSFGSDEQLLCNPVPELEKLREKEVFSQQYSPEYSEANIPCNIKGDSLEIIAEFEFDESAETEFGLSLRRSNDGTEETLVIYNSKSRELTVDRSHSGVGNTGISRCYMTFASYKKLKLRIFIDKSSIEVFANEGQAVISDRIYPHPDSTGIMLCIRKGKVKTVLMRIWKLKL